MQDHVYRTGPQAPAVTDAEEVAAALQVLLKHLPPDDARAGDYLKAIIGTITSHMNLRRVLGR